MCAKRASSSAVPSSHASAAGCGNCRLRRKVGGGGGQQGHRWLCQHRVGWATAAWAPLAGQLLPMQAVRRAESARGPAVQLAHTSQSTSLAPECWRPGLHSQLLEVAHGLFPDVVFAYVPRVRVVGTAAPPPKLRGHLVILPVATVPVASRKSGAVPVISAPFSTVPVTGRGRGHRAVSPRARAAGAAGVSCVSRGSVQAVLNAFVPALAVVGIVAPRLVSRR